MFFSAVGKAFKRFWLVGVAVACVTGLGLYARLGTVSFADADAGAVAGACMLAILLIGVPLELGKRKQ